MLPVVLSWRIVILTVYLRASMIYQINFQNVCKCKARPTFATIEWISPVRLFLKRTSNSCLGFLNILRISASNVLRMFFNITVSNGCAFLIFHSHKPIGRIKTLNYQYYNIYISVSIICYPGRQKSNKVVNKKDLKTKFYMHNTIKAMLH